MHQSCHHDGCQAMGRSPSLFLPSEPWVFDNHVSHNDIIIIVIIIIIIMPHIYLLLSHKPIGDKYQRGRAFPHCRITHLSGFKMILWQITICILVAHCLLAHPFSFKTVRNIHQWEWLHVNRLVAHLLRLKMIGDHFYQTGHIYLCLLARWGQSIPSDDDLLM